jgi:16S rRNA (guanine(966)-N(2))-methyltransferase RsmD
MTTQHRLRTAPRQVRIIGGQWKRTPLPVPDVAGLRPTPDRVRETLFNWLQHLRPDVPTLNGLDLFAGTGALGFELASRGARSVLLVESNPQALQSLRATRERLAAAAVEVRPGDGLSVAAALPTGSFDVIFLDPPFDAGLQGPALAAVRRLLAAGGLLYLEAPTVLAPEQARQAGLEIVRSGRAGQVSFHLLRQPTA